MLKKPSDPDSKIIPVPKSSLHRFQILYLDSLRIVHCPKQENARVMFCLPKRWLALLGLFTLAALLADSALAQQPELKAEAETAPSVSDAYRIRSGDKLSVKFLYHPELNEPSVTVRPDGLINLQMIDEVAAKGLTVSELKASIEKAYSETLLNPIVSVSLVEFVGLRVYVGGQVAKPGSYELRAAQTLIQAIFLAGGFTRDANRKMVLHAHPVEGGNLKMATFDVAQMLSDSKRTQEVLLQDGDYIFIPDSRLSKISRVLEAFRAAIPNIGLDWRR
jgi:polysaccharide export outer membrane protein